MTYHVGYRLPVVDMHKQMHNETHQVSADQKTYTPVNRFYQFPTLVTPSNSGNFRALNNDTLYYTAWFDISDQPLIIHTPDTQGRYYTIAVTNQYFEVTHIGRRTTGTAEQFFALVPPHWQGELPDGVKAVPVETNYGWLLGRMLVDGEADFAEAKALVDDIWLASLDEFNPAAQPALPPAKTADALDILENLEFYSVLNQHLKHLPRRGGEDILLAQFDQVGFGPNSNFDPNTIDEATKAGLLRGIQDGVEVVAAGTQRTIPGFNGWMISKQIGRYPNYPLMHRAAVVKGGYGNLPEESLYPARLFDDEGNWLNGDNHYSLRFNADELPPVDGFWSLSVYRISDMQLEENAIKRYSIGDRTSGLQLAADGSLTISLQYQQPASAEANWMPVPAGNFAVVMRFYEPQPAALDNTFLLPKIEKLN